MLTTRKPALIRKSLDFQMLRLRNTKSLERRRNGLESSANSDRSGEGPMLRGKVTNIFWLVSGERLSVRKLARQNSRLTCIWDIFRSIVSWDFSRALWEGKFRLTLLIWRVFLNRTFRSRLLLNLIERYTTINIDTKLYSLSNNTILLLLLCQFHLRNAFHLPKVPDAVHFDFRYTQAPKLPANAEFEVVLQ